MKSEISIDKETQEEIKIFFKTQKIKYIIQKIKNIKQH